MGMALLGCIVIGLVSDARADLIVTAQSVSANAGSTGNTLEVYLMNTGPSAVDVAGFSFEVSTASSDINFTSASVTTTPDAYIFAGNSLFGPVISVNSGQTLDASDINAAGSTTVGAGSTWGLGEVSFDVAPGTAAGPYSVVFGPFPATGLSDLNANNLSIGSLINGQITVNGTTSVPEPSGFLLLITGAVGLYAPIRRKLRG